LIGALPVTASPGKRMDERQKLYDDLKRYRALRNLKNDEPTIEAIEIMIAETEDRVAQLERV
jgi:hypothetical protein